MGPQQPKPDVRSIAIEVIRDYAGGPAASMYQDFYASSEEAVVLESLTALLDEYVGPAKAQQVLLSRGLKNHYEQVQAFIYRPLCDWYRCFFTHQTDDAFFLNQLCISSDRLQRL